MADGVTFLTDSELRGQAGIVAAFTQRGGGVSAPPFDSLNLAGHVGDAAESVDENRRRALRALGLGSLESRLVTAEQVHGTRIEVVGEADAGRGAAASRGIAPVPGCDALVTMAPRVPLLMMYADCVPVILAVARQRRGIAVAHAGWKGALAGLPGLATEALCSATGADARDVVAFVGPHIGECCYEVDAPRADAFSEAFEAPVTGKNRIDLSEAVIESLTRAGVRSAAIASADICTSDHTENYYSFRAASRTGRHGAIAVLL
jgi:YfiH family protein